MIKDYNAFAFNKQKSKWDQINSMTQNALTWIR